MATPTDDKATGSEHCIPLFCGSVRFSLIACAFVALWAVTPFVQASEVTGGWDASDCALQQVSELRQSTDNAPLLQDLSRKYLAAYDATSLDALLAQRDGRVSTVICYDLGQQFPALARFWPSSAQKFLLVLSPALEKHRNALQSVIVDAMTYAGKKWFATPPLTVAFLLVETEDQMVRELVAWGTPPEVLTSAQRAWRDHCQPSSEFGGFANAFVVVLCFPGGPDQHRLDDSQQWVHLSEAFIHETIHAFQLQSSGALIGRAEHGHTDFGAPGPTWLLEGFAEYAALSRWSTPEEIKARQTKLLATHQRPGQSRCAILQEQHEHVPTDHGSRPAGILAAAELAENHGKSAFALFYADIAFSFDWRTSFGRAFGPKARKAILCE